MSVIESPSGVYKHDGQTSMVLLLRCVCVFFCEFINHFSTRKPATIFKRSIFSESISDLVVEAILLIICCNLFNNLEKPSEKRENVRQLWFDYFRLSLFVVIWSKMIVKTCNLHRILIIALSKNEQFLLFFLKTIFRHFKFFYTTVVISCSH